MTPPYPLIDAPSGQVDYQDIANTCWIDMAIVHNTFLRGMNSIYEKAPHVQPADEIAFAGYCLCAVASIHVHHKGEEQIMFPHLSKRLDMSHNIHEHEEFTKGLNVFQEYMQSVFDRTEKYDAEKTRQLLRGFGDLLAQHLHDEIPTVMPDQLRKFEKGELEAMMKEHGDYVKKDPALFTVFPWTLSHHNALEMPYWPPLPGPLKWFARTFSGLRYPSYWKFSPYDLKGNAKHYP
ncbi:hypothetical protein AMATHDRAFT_54497 [Amanita thiersii Skay4041]|uniref:Hemerythrin-like domain-containing protein n=1 Tax=Amanita thiersii Skay4041 TaxID=703135 RepID=A0A2A9NSD8_9AGAR|nr:hypothetical protein AMATHDRAFT_54497 [Amanita thiersii Skay4041]